MIFFINEIKKCQLTDNKLLLGMIPLINVNSY